MAPLLRRFSSSSSSASDDDTNAAIDAIIAEASDLIALEHVAALNTAHLSDSALLPSDLEARFRNLKSFPPDTPKTAPPLPRAPPENDDLGVAGGGLDRSRTAPIPHVDADNTQKATKPSEVGDQDLGSPEQEARKKPKSEYDFGSPISSPFSFGSLKGPLSSSSPSPSPPKQRCCFGFSPKKVAAAVQSRKKGDEVVPELTVQALKEERRKLKKALEQQAMLTREAARMVRSAKRSSVRSARMTSAIVDELLSDLDEELK